MTHLTFAPDGSVLTTSSIDGNVRMFGIPAGNLIRSLDIMRSTQYPVAVAYSPDGKLLATGGNEILIWNVSNCDRVGRLDFNAQKIQARSFSHDGRLLAVGGTRLVKIYDLKTRRKVDALKAHRGPIVDVAFSPTSLTLVSASSDGCTKIWSNKRWSLEQPSSTYGRWRLSVRFTGHGPSKSLIVGCGSIHPSQDEGCVSVLDLHNGETRIWH